MINISDYARKTYSQRGEDGMIECVFNTLEIQKGWCCEFGAWDGIHLSNVYKLITEGWSGLMIEGDPVKYKELEWNMREFSNVSTENTFVSLEPANKLNVLLAKNQAPADIDLLSIDIDSIDYWVWASLTYQPKVIVIEYNSNWEDKVTVPYEYPFTDWEWNQYFGASATALEELGKHKGYDLIGFVPYTNLFFVRSGLNRDLFEKLDLSTSKHLSLGHHKPMTAEQQDRLIYNPSFS